jgi:hypothetical protein
MNPSPPSVFRLPAGRPVHVLNFSFFQAKKAKAVKAVAEGKMKSPV